MGLDVAWCRHQDARTYAECSGNHAVFAGLCEADGQVRSRGGYVDDAVAKFEVDPQRRVARQQSRNDRRNQLSSESGRRVDPETPSLAARRLALAASSPSTSAWA